MKVQGRLIIDLMRGCLTEMSKSLQGLRQEAGEQEAEAFPIVKNAVLFSLDMNLAAIHMLGMKLMNALDAGRVELSDSERVIIGMSSTFMSEGIAKLIDDALEGYTVTDEQVREQTGYEGDAPASSEPVH